MNREYHKWYSQRLHRDMELLIFGHAGAKVLAFPTRCGRFYEYENMGMIEALRHKIDGGQLQLYCVDSIDEESFYCFWNHPADRIPRHLQYESYLLEEVLPLMWLKNSHDCVISHGCSFGAFHALNLAFRHPQAFHKVVALSGRYDLTLSVENFRNLLDGHYDERVYFNNPSHFLPNLSDSYLLDHLRRMDIVLAVGDQDPFLDNNRHLSESLWQKGVWHALHVWQGRAHSPRYWRKMVDLYV
ncbi:MAG: esterase family protein [Candidatus Competibacteraceae bacterium]|nr:esterase family protein [Candidatus Competibacteraceae bacterium]HRY15990.1 alpha/beta hydrolase-fold protein [Candidatus Competibacteraceae bacterium]